MGSADHQFNLAELLTQNYNLQEGCAEAPQCPEKPEEELHKDFIDQVWGLTRPCPVALPGLHVIQPHAHGLHRGPASEPALSFGDTQTCGVCVLLTSSVVLMQVHCSM